MEKRVIVFLLLSLAIIFGYEYVLKELGFAPPPSPPENSTPLGGPSSPSSDSMNEKKDPGEAPPVATPAMKNSQSRGTGMPATEADIVTIDTELYRAKFSTRGAVITSWELKRYRESS